MRATFTRLRNRLRRAHGFQRRRRQLASRFINGNGIEIGALNEPLELPPGVSCRYIDRLGMEELARMYPELAPESLTPVDVVEEGEKLSSIPGGSLDFIVANHFIEHTEDPVGTIERHLAVLRPGGILFMAVPDKRFTFDAGRNVTPLDHVLRDYRDGPAWSRQGHYEEFMRRHPQLAGVEQEFADGLARSHMHFHVWTREGFTELLAQLQAEMAFEIEAVEPNYHEFIVVLRKR